MLTPQQLAMDSISSLTEFIIAWERKEFLYDGQDFSNAADSIVGCMWQSFNNKYYTFQGLPKSLQKESAWLFVPQLPRYFAAYRPKGPVAVIGTEDYGHPLLNLFTTAHEVGHIITSAKQKPKQRERLTLARDASFSNETKKYYANKNDKVLILKEEQAAWDKGKQLLMYCFDDDLHAKNT